MHGAFVQMTTTTLFVRVVNCNNLGCATIDCTMKALLAISDGQSLIRDILVGEAIL